MRMSILSHTILFSVTLTAVAAQSPEFRHLQGGKFHGARFLDSSRGFVSSDGGRVHWTTNGGQDWTEATMPPAIATQVQLRGMCFIELESDLIGWVVGDGGVVLRTVDNSEGKVWEDINASARITNNVGGGSPCAPIGQLAELYDIFMVNVLDGYAVGNDGVLVVTDDGGETWTDIASNLPGSFGCSDAPLDLYDVHFFQDSGAGADYSKGVVASEYGDLFVTENSGASWAEVDLRSEIGTEECPASGHNLEMWQVDFDDPADADSAWWAAGGYNTNIGYIFRKSSGWSSGTWSQSYCYDLQDPQMVEDAETCSVPTIYGIATLGTSDPEAFIAGYGGGVFVRETGTPNFDPCSCLDDQDAGFTNPCGTNVPTWVQKDTALGIEQCSDRTPFFAVAKISSTQACAVGMFGRIVRYVEGASPELVDEANTAFTRLQGGDFIDGDTGCVIGQGYMIWRTEDGGETWTNVSGNWSCDGGEQGYALAFSSSGTYGAAVGSNGFSAYSTDGGETWTLGNDTGADLYAVCFAPDESVAYAVGAGGAVRKSTNYAQFWRGAASPGSEDLFGVSFSDDDDGYAVGANKKAYRTTSGASSWASVTVLGGGSAALKSVVTWGGGSVAVAVGANGTVFERNGTTFNLVTDSGFQALGITDELYDVQVLLNGSDIDLRIGGNDGTVLFRDGGVWSQPKSRTNFPIYQVSFQSSTHGFGIGLNFIIVEYTD